MFGFVVSFMKKKTKLTFIVLWTGIDTFNFYILKISDKSGLTFVIYQRKKEQFAMCLVESYKMSIYKLTFEASSETHWILLKSTSNCSVHFLIIPIYLPYFHNHEATRPSWRKFETFRCALWSQKYGILTWQLSKSLLLLHSFIIRTATK